MTGRVGSIVLVWAACAAACSGPQPTTPVSLTVGSRAVELVVPEGWHHFDHGNSHRFERDRHQITLTDLGPATGKAYRRELVHARELYRRGQIEDARTWLCRIELRRAFPSEKRWDSIRRLWRVVHDAGGYDSIGASEVDDAYEGLLTHVAVLPEPDLDTIADRVLAELDRNGMRDVAERETLRIDFRPAQRIDTWDRLSHRQRKRHLFVLDDGNLLMLRMELGEFAVMEPALSTLTESMRLPRS